MWVPPVLTEPDLAKERERYNEYGTETRAKMAKYTKIFGEHFSHEGNRGRELGHPVSAVLLYYYVN